MILLLFVLMVMCGVTALVLAAAAAGSLYDGYPADFLICSALAGLAGFGAWYFGGMTFV